MTSLSDYWSSVYGIDGSLASYVQLLLDQNNPTSLGTATYWYDLSVGQHHFRQGTAGNQPSLNTGTPNYRDFDGGDFVLLEENDSEQGALSYTTEGALSTFTDAGQSFTAWAGSTIASYRIVVHNDDATTTHAYLGAVVNPLAPTEIKVYQEASLTTNGWLGTAPAGKTPSTYEIHKSFGSNNFTGDLTFLWFWKPDDGQPAADQFVFSNYVSVPGFYVRHQSNGKVDFVRSINGVALAQDVASSNAVYADGAQASYSSVAIVADISNGTGAIYYNGAVVASVESLTTTATYDTYHPLLIGALNTGSGFINAQVSTAMIFSVAASATQIARIHNTIKGRYGL